MAVNWKSESSTSALDSLKRRVLPACLAGALLIGGIHLLTGWLVDDSSRKVTANQFVSPWDKKQIPPVLRASHVVAKANVVEPGPAVDVEKPRAAKRSRSWRHHVRKHSIRRATGTAADYRQGYPSF